VPDAILTFEEVSLANPLPDSSDQRTDEFRSEDGFDPIESTHACVALTFNERPWVDGARLPASTAEVDVRASEATCTFTRGGTVTLTVCVRLLEAPR
jgi:hypothetical protein